jgi:soluble lytic murein transglycosylase-like protein
MMRIRCNRPVRSAAAVVLWVCTAPIAVRAEPAANLVAESSAPWSADITEASQRFGVPASWIRAVMQIESGGDARALSPKGAMGLMQIMPETWAELRGRYGLGTNPFNPRDNILAGAAYLREMHHRYGYPGLFAAYNAGPRRVDEHLSEGRPLPAETQAYLAALGHGGVGPARSSAIARGASLFVDLNAGGREAAFRPLSDGSLFVPVKAMRGPGR